MPTMFRLVNRREQLAARGLAAFCAIALACACSARADLVAFDSAAGGVGSFEGTPAAMRATFEYYALSPTTGALSLVLENTTGATPGGAMTAIALTAPANATLTFGGAVGDDDGNWSVNHFRKLPTALGSFGSVFTVDGKNYGGAGSGNTGVEPSDLGVTFSWAVSASDAASLSVSDFLQPNSRGYRAAFRFKGIGPDESSDSLVLIPAPGAALLGVTGLALVGLFRRHIA